MCSDTHVKNLLNCWKSLKLYILQRKYEIRLSVNVTKVEKKYIDDARLNPKHCNNGQSAAKLRIGERSTTIPHGSRITSDW